MFMQKFYIVFFMIVSCILFGFNSRDDDLKISDDDVYIEAHSDGFHLFVRKKPFIKSIILTESFETPDKRKALSTYSFRTLKYNKINGDEIRILNGRVVRNNKLLSLTSSIPVPNKKLGKAFHILIPIKLTYGFPEIGTRSEIIDLENLKTKKQPFWFSIRTFEKKYNDYSGFYKDNAYELFFKEDRQNDGNKLGIEALKDSFSKFSNIIASGNKKSIVNKIDNLLLDYKDENLNLDLVLVIDATASMKENIKILKDNLFEIIKPRLEGFKSYRVGIVFYKDYLEDFLTKAFDFNSIEYLKNILNYINVGGGGDYPEAVFEGINAAVTQFDWKADRRFIIVIGDAPPHEYPRGSVAYEDVVQRIKEKGITIYGMIFQ